MRAGSAASKKAWPAVGTYLRERTGHDFPVLSRLHHARAVRTVASMVRENLDPTTTVVGLDTKVLAGAVFAGVIGDLALAEDIRALALAAAVRFGRDASEPVPVRDARSRAAVALSRAASPSPAEIDHEIVATCREADLSAPAIVELVSWLSVLQMLHRLGAFYATAWRDRPRPA
jgi:hypothetical protein